jgi:hypothetical protein
LSSSAIDRKSGEAAKLFQRGRVLDAQQHGASTIDQREAIYGNLELLTRPQLPRDRHDRMGIVSAANPHHRLATRRTMSRCSRLGMAGKARSAPGLFLPALAQLRRSGFIFLDREVGESKITDRATNHSN